MCACACVGVCVCLREYIYLQLVCTQVKSNKITQRNEAGLSSIKIKYYDILVYSIDLKYSIDITSTVFNLVFRILFTNNIFLIPCIYLSSKVSSYLNMGNQLI